MKVRLFTPGPTPLPEQVRLSQAKNIGHHRTVEFAEIFREVCHGLQYVFQTTNNVLVFAASGTGTMEAVVTNFFSPGDQVLVIRGGKFGERWGEIGDTFGLTITCMDVEWGRAPDPAEVERVLRANKNIKAVFTQLVETSTAVRYDVQRMSRVVNKTSAIMIVDAISGLGAEPLFTDEWNVDVVVAASQKALMLPPGLAFVSVSEKAWRFVEEAAFPRYYWDFRKARSFLANGQTPYTPAISLINALRESLVLIEEKGLHSVLDQQQMFAEAVRRATISMGLQVFGNPSSNALTAIVVPLDVQEKELRKKLRDDFGIIVSGGQAKLSGKIVRMAHLGWMDKLDIIAVIAALEMSLSKLGYKVELGRGVQAAEEVLTGNIPC